MPHKFYEPTEYESMLLAARWISMEDVDGEYQTYMRNTPYPEFLMTYDEWRGKLNELDELAARYDAEIAPLLTADPCYLNYEQKRLMSSLCNKMSDIETLLGY